MTLQLDRVTGRFAVARLEAGSGWPHWMTWSRGFSTVTRTPDETTVVCEEHLVPAGVRAERGFAAYAVRGSLDFSAVGILARVSSALADADVSLLAFATFETDVILVREASAIDAERAWRSGGIAVEP
ncbi:MAG: ACT domain-containing protein [Gemmatimonadota bacterium]